MTEAFSDLRGTWQYQGFDDDTLRAWRRLLPRVTFDDFKITLARFENSKRRPTVGEFGSMLNAVATERRQRERDAERRRERAQEPDTPPEVASQRIAEIKDELRAKGVRCG